MQWPSEYQLHVMTLLVHVIELHQLDCLVLNCHRMYVFVQLLKWHDLQFFYRHVSRCVLIPFSLPEIGGQTKEEQATWQGLEETWLASSSCVGYLISLGSILVKEAGV